MRNKTKQEIFFETSGEKTQEENLREFWEGSFPGLFTCGCDFDALNDVPVSVRSGRWRVRPCTRTD